MIDFRYFLVSIAAIFLALAVGVALGAGPLKGEIDAQLRSNVDQLGKEKEALRAEIEQLQGAQKYRDAFAALVAPEMIEGRLSGKSVVLVALPGADGELVNNLAGAIRAADATYTGTVQITEKWADPSERRFLQDLADQLASDEIRVPQDGSAYDQAGALLARAVVATSTTSPGTSQQTSGTDGTDGRDEADGDGAGEADAAASTILGAFGQSDLIKADADLPRAELAVVVAPNAADNASDSATEEAKDENAAWVALSRALDQAGNGAVLAGDLSSAVEPGTVAALRADARASAEVSTVDVADVPSGRVAVIWALLEQFDGKKGQYGAGSGVDGVLPRLAGTS